MNERMKRIIFFLFIAIALMLSTYLFIPRGQSIESLGIYSSIVAFMWTSFSYFDQLAKQEQNQKQIEKIKFLNQRELEAYKIYVQQKNEKIVNLYEKIDGLLSACTSLSIAGKDHIDYFNLKEGQLLIYLDARRILPQYRENIIRAWREQCQNQKVNEKGYNIMEYQIYFSSYLSHYDDMAHAIEAIRGCGLYLNDKIFSEIKSFVLDLVGVFYELYPEYYDAAPERRQHISSYCKEMDKQFTGNIRELLRKELKKEYDD